VGAGLLREVAGGRGQRPLLGAVPQLGQRPRPSGNSAGAMATLPRAATPPRWEVEGCGMDLSSAKPYYCHHKVCLMHVKAPIVVVADIEQHLKRTSLSCTSSSAAAASPHAT
jgi:hypothetical protein